MAALRSAENDRGTLHQGLRALTFEERLVSTAITCTWLIYAVGGLYLAGPIVACVLVGTMIWRAVVRHEGSATHALRPAPIGAWLWLAGMAGMLMALITAHLGESLGALSLLKSSIGWMKGWGLFAAFVMAGACLRLRATVIVRALCVLSVQCLALAPMLVLAALVHMPALLFVSPLQVVGGPGPEFFAIRLYIIDPSSGSPRWPFFAPWAPAAGLMGNLMFVAALYEPRRWLKWAALAGATLIVILTASRMALIFLVTIPPLVWLLTRLGDRRVIAGLAASSLLAGVFADTILDRIDQAVSAFKGARASSSRVRDVLGRIAVDRWWNDALLVGHGVVQRGPHIVEFMPIGSHHTWYGLLYVKGIVGAASLALPLIWTTLEMLLLAQVSRTGGLGLTLSLLLIFYTFGENLEILSYLFYPALVLLGAAFAEAAQPRAAEADGTLAGAPTAIGAAVRSPRAALAL